jgi:hypothetical protein
MGGCKCVVCAVLCVGLVSVMLAAIYQAVPMRLPVPFLLPGVYKDNTTTHTVHLIPNKTTMVTVRPVGGLSEATERDVEVHIHWIHPPPHQHKTSSAGKLCFRAVCLYSLSSTHLKQQDIAGNHMYRSVERLTMYRQDTLAKRYCDCASVLLTRSVRGPYWTSTDSASISAWHLWGATFQSSLLSLYRFSSVVTYKQLT